MTRAQLVTRMAEAAGWPRAVSDRALRAMLGAVRVSLKRGDPVTLVGFGTFGVRSRAARKGRHPRTGQEMWLPADRKPTFKAGKGLRHAVR